MKIIVSASSMLPLYEQIINQIQTAIIKGDVKPGDLLPSIRMLAADLRVSIITTKRAYDDLEAAGLIMTVAGKGTFVAQANTQRLYEAAMAQIEQYLSKAVKLSKNAQIPPDVLCSVIKAIYKEEDQ